MQDATEVIPLSGIRLLLIHGCITGVITGILTIYGFTAFYVLPEMFR